MTVSVTVTVSVNFAGVYLARMKHYAFALLARTNYYSIAFELNESEREIVTAMKF